MAKFWFVLAFLPSVTCCSGKGSFDLPNQGNIPEKAHYLRRKPLVHHPYADPQPKYFHQVTKRLWSFSLQKMSPLVLQGIHVCRRELKPKCSAKKGGNRKANLFMKKIIILLVLICNLHFQKAWFSALNFVEQSRNTNGYIYIRWIPSHPQSASSQKELQNTPQDSMCLNLDVPSQSHVTESHGALPKQTNCSNPCETKSKCKNFITHLHKGFFLKNPGRGAVPKVPAPEGLVLGCGWV